MFLEVLIDDCPIFYAKVVGHVEEKRREARASDKVKNDVVYLINRNREMVILYRKACRKTFEVYSRTSQV